MIQVSNVSLKFGKRVLFEDVNIKFTNGNCYGLIGANGSGKSTFLKLLSGELDTTTGEITVSKGERISILKQDHYQFDDKRVIDVVIMGNSKLYEIMEEKDKMYQQTEFSEEDGMKLANLEAEFMDLDGWNAEPDAAQLLNNLGVDEEFHYMNMGDLPVKLRVKVLLAQSLFGNPDILLYICETGDGKQAMRSRLFIRWFNTYSHRDAYILETAEVMEGETKNFAALIVQKSNPRLTEIVSEFRETISILTNKPE